MHFMKKLVWFLAIVFTFQSADADAYVRRARARGPGRHDSSKAPVTTPQPLRALDCSNDAATERVGLGDVTTGGATSMTWSFWSYDASFGTEDLLCKFTSSTTYEWCIEHDSSRRLVVLISPDTLTFGRWRSATNALSLSAWDHVFVRLDTAQVTDATILRVWVNGTEITSGGTYLNSFSILSVVPMADSTLAVNICNSGGTGSNAFIGSIDEVAIWKNQLIDVSVPRSVSGHPNGLTASMSTKPTWCWDFESPDTTGAGAVADKCGSPAFNGTFTNGEAGDFQTTNVP